MNEQYCFTPDDIALFLLLSEMPLRDGNEMLDDLFHAHNMELIPAYCRVSGYSVKRFVSAAQ